MIDLIKEISNIVKKECQKDTNVFGVEAYDSHFVSTVKYAKQLAEKRGADREITEIAAWLHDIGSIIGDYENHHITSANYAENILKQFNYPQEKIEKIKHCIAAHRGSKNIPRESVEADCLADADSMSHFDTIHSLFRLALKVNKLDETAAKEFVVNKLERSWNKLSGEAKEIIKPKYKAVKILFK